MMAVRVHQATEQKPRQQPLLEIAAVLIIQLIIRAGVLGQPFAQLRLQFFENATNFHYQCIRNQAIKFGC